MAVSKKKSAKAPIKKSVKKATRPTAPKKAGRKKKSAALFDELIKRSDTIKAISKKKSKNIVHKTTVDLKKNLKPARKFSQITSSTHDRIAGAVRKHSHTKSPILIISGEHSGDLLGAETVQALNTYGYNEFYGTGGDAMQASGVEIIEHIDTMNVVGFVEALYAYKKLKKLANDLIEEALKRKTRLVILIDYPGFNLRFAQMLKAHDIKIVYIVSPQIWAWKYNRIHTIKRLVDLMLPLFPFEEKIYLDEGINSHAIGHPMVTRIPKKLRQEKALPLVSAKIKKNIGLIPGSRRGEVSRLLEDMLGAARLLHERFPGTRFLLPCADPKLLPMIEELLTNYQDLHVEVLHDSTYQIMKTCDSVIIASGTATLETAFFKTPMVVLYRVGWINFILGTLLMRVRFIGIVNILGRKQTVVELLQTEVTPNNIFHEMEKILTDDKYRNNMILELAYVKRQLGSGNPARKAAALIYEFIASGR